MDRAKYKPLIDSDAFWHWYLMPTPTLTLKQIDQLGPVRKFQYLRDIALTERIVQSAADAALRRMEKRRPRGRSSNQ